MEEKKQPNFNSKRNPNVTRIKQKSNNIFIPKFKIPLELPQSLLDLIDDVEISPDGTINSSIPWLQNMRENLFSDPQANKMMINILNGAGENLAKSQKDKIDILLNVLERGETGNIITPHPPKKKIHDNFSHNDFFEGKSEEKPPVSILDLNRYQPLETRDEEDEEKKMEFMEHRRDEEKQKKVNFPTTSYQFSPAMDVLEHMKRIREFNDLGTWHDGVKEQKLPAEEEMRVELGGMKKSAKPIKFDVLKNLFSMSVVS